MPEWVSLLALCTFVAGVAFCVGGVVGARLQLKALSDRKSSKD
jgi:hypothetical protein